MRKIKGFIWILFVVASMAACNLGTVQPTPVPTPDLPRIRFLSPSNNSNVVENYDLPIDILGRDETSGIATIEFYVDGELINSASPETGSAVPIFRVEMNWQTYGIGLHVFSAIAYRADGVRGDEAFLNINVVPGE